MTDRIFRNDRYRAVLVIVAVCALSGSTAAREGGRTPVTVFTAIEQEISAGQTFVATVMPSKRAVIGSPVDGRVIELVVHEGQRVEKFTPIVRLLTTTIELDLVALQAELDLRQQELVELENGSRPSVIEQAEAKMRGAKSRVTYTQARFQRLMKLFRSQAVSQEELDEAAALADESSQMYIDLKAAHQLTVEGPRPEKVAQARAQVARQQALVDRLQGIIHRHAIISRFDGYVIAEHTEEGAWVKAGDPVMEVVALDEVDVEAFVAEQHAPFVKPGMSVRVEVPSLPDRIFSGTVTTIIPQADMRARTFPVKIRVKNEIGKEGPVLKSGMYARVELPTGPTQKSVMVPKDALVLGGPQPLIYIVDELNNKNGIAKSMPVQLGVATENLIQVKSDLKPGQLVIVEGNERLRVGQNVVITRTVPSL